MYIATSYFHLTFVHKLSWIYLQYILTHAVRYFISTKLPYLRGVHKSLWAVAPRILSD
jgi:hypothetical protein